MNWQGATEDHEHLLEPGEKCSGKKKQNKEQEEQKICAYNRTHEQSSVS